MLFPLNDSTSTSQRLLMPTYISKLLSMKPYLSAVEQQNGGSLRACQ